MGPLTPTWNCNANYSFGWLIPVVSLVLFAERWPLRPARHISNSFRFTLPAVVWGIVFLGFRLAAETDPDWRPGLWTLVTLYIVALGGWLWLEGGLSWVRHFAFPIGFLVLCLPWPFGVEYPLVQGLMRWNAVLVSDSLQGLGLIAQPQGNVIQLQNCQLGVEEACSGILSLQASLVMGCLMGDIYRLSVRRRIILVAASMTLALLGNYLRTLFLALIAVYSSPDSVPLWHDTAGYAILVFTAIGSWAAALYLLATSGKTAPVDAEGTEKSVGRDNRLPTKPALHWAMIVFALAVFAEIVTQGWFGWRESSLSYHPGWSVKLPTTDQTFKPIPLSDVTLQALRCDDHQTGQWQDAKGWSWSVYWLRYQPKPYSRVVLSWHTPDNCLPSVGLTKVGEFPAFTAHIKGLDLFVRPKKFLSKDMPVFVFWLVYPNRGKLPDENYPTGGVPTSTKFKSHLQDVWNGYRGVGVETMEVAVVGPVKYEDAKAAFLEMLATMALPEKMAPISASESSR